MSLNSLRNGYVNGEGKLRIDYKFWENRKVLMTGHTGFKGAWFVQLLRSFGAKVHGFSLPPPSQPSLYERAKLSALLDLEVLGDIRNQSLLKEVIDTVDPDVVIHMAAQSLVPASYLDPMETWSVNVMGTVSVLEACRRKKAIRVIGIVTSDKCYWNSGSGDAFKETDTLGGKDPYSASKASAELVAKSYFYSCLKEENPNSSLITLRAGNILGGGDWAANRLIPDLIRAIVQKQSLGIRMPSAIRPWQYVLDALLGYSMALQDAARESGRLDHWNFAPPSANLEVSHILSLAKEFFPGLEWDVIDAAANRESQVLNLDAQKARQQLGWRSLYHVEEVVQRTLNWYKSHHEGHNARKLCEREITQVLDDVRSLDQMNV